jgi:hypothetical protein
MKPLFDWAMKWGVPLHITQDLMQRLGAGFDSPQNTSHAGMSETAVQSRVRLDASKQGIILWRNNVGVLEDVTGRPVRYGLCNDTPELNKRIKSGDLIGIRPVTITPAMIGCTIGQFTSREVKEGGWKYTGTERETAQLKWIERVISLGGDASFATGEGSF